MTTAPDVGTAGLPPPSVRVLIAEDDDATRTMLCQQLSGFGHDVVANVATGREAVDRARELAPEVVLLDVYMPDGSGLEAAEQIAHHQSTIAVVLFTGDSSLLLSQADVVRTTALALLPKPTQPRVLDATIRLAAVRARELRSARAEVIELRAQLEGRKMIERAKGILMRRTGLTEQEAYRILQRTSQDRSVPMHEIAKEVLDSEPGK